MNDASNKQIQFVDNPDVFCVEPYSVVYGKHPSLCVRSGPIGNFKMCDLPNGADPFAGVDAAVLKERRAQSTKGDRTKRERVLDTCHRDGAAWETSSAALLEAFFCAAAPKKKVQEVHEEAPRCQKSKGP